MSLGFPCPLQISYGSPHCEFALNALESSESIVETIGISCIINIRRLKLNNNCSFMVVKVPIFEHPFECRQFLQQTDYLVHNRCLHLHLHLHHRYLHLVQMNPH